MRHRGRTAGPAWRAARTILALTAACLGALELAAVPVASAHPLGNFTVNRYSDIDLAPGIAHVRYVVDMAEIPTYQEMPNIDTDHDGSASAAERQFWATRTAADLIRRVTLTIDGTPIHLHTAGASMEFRSGQAGLSILRLEASFEGALPALSGFVSYRDGNYQGRIGWREITVRSEPGVTIVGSSVPPTSVSRALLAYPVDMLSTPLDVTSAAFSFRPGAGTSGSIRSVKGSTVGGAPVASGGSFARLIRWRLTPIVLAFSLMLAFGFGAVHALGPGHGKTITAAYLVGAGARRASAVAVGVAVSLMHTMSVLLLGLVFLVLARSLPPDRIYPWLELTTGLVAIGLGGYLLRTRLRARPTGEDHAHDPAHRHGARDGGAGHVHAHTAHAGDARRAAGPRSVLALAVAGGILPSPTAFVVLLGAVRAHRIAYGLVLILAFSAGLAAALMGVGLVAIRARVAVTERLADRWARVLPVASAAAILAFGVFFVTRGGVRLI